MKDQYFGDFGDYQKISLLRHLQQAGLSVSVHWMKTKDDLSTDGKHITYLDKPELWRLFEPDIFDFLKRKILSGKRSTAHIERSKFCSGVNFISEYIEEFQIREQALTQVLKRNSDIILFDPDNGIEVLSTNKRNLHKYVTWREIAQTFESGKSVVLYQHFSRSNRASFIRGKIEEIQKRLSSGVIAVQARHSAYLFLPQKGHERKVEKAVKNFSNTWKEFAVIH